MSCTDWGGAMSTFCENFGDDGKPLAKMFSFTTLGLTLDQAMDLFNIHEPTHLRIDVDGLEHLILSGGETVLRRISDLLIEVNEDFTEQKICVSTVCRNAGLVLKEKRHSNMFNEDETLRNTYN